MKVTVFVSPKKGSLDPQGSAVQQAMHSLDYQQASEVRVGKIIEWVTDEKDTPELRKTIDELCRNLLSNPVLEDYRYELQES